MPATSPRSSGLTTHPDLLLLRQGPERSQDLIMKCHKSPLEMLLRLPREFKLHVRNLLDHVLHGNVDGVPSDFVLSAKLGHHLLGCFVEANNDLHHTDGLCQWAHEIVVSEAILLQEVLSDDLCHFQSAFLILGQGVLADKLHDFLKIILLLQDFLHLLLQHAVLCVILLKVRLQDSNVLGEGDVPIHRWEMLSLRELFVQAPEDLHDAQSCRGHRVCEVTPRW
mmetsp:Transcript_7659/g.13558  ORF Transcript_7659/g.13558 Transcript_7659/m.13558 type:complete len:224 (-) Transcript_7659:194-865(-)